MLISHRRRPRRLVPLLVATALIFAMNAPGLTALAGEVTTTGDDPNVVAQEEVVAEVPEEPEAAPEEPAEEPDAVPPGDEVTDSDEVAPMTAEAPMVELAAEPIVLAVEPITELALPYAEVGAVQLEGYTRAPHEKWTSGDVKGYVEGEWIPFRLSIDNTHGSDVTVQVPSMIYKVDHIMGGAVAIDETANWRWAVDDGTQTAYHPIDQDNDGDPQYLETQLPEDGAFILEKGQTGYIYFEGHLALTPYWMPLEGLYGASGYPGSSAQARLVQWNGINIGDRTVPFPVGKETAPTGELHGLKYEDLNGNDTQDAGEGPLAGWVFHLEYQDADYGFSVTATSAADGTFGFTGLPPGSYLLSEDTKAGWTLVTDLSGTIAVATGATTGPIKVGNSPSMVDKTWRLDLSDAVPMADSYFVRYAIGGQDYERTLTPGVDSTMQVAWGTTITSWQFFAMMGDEEIPLSGVLGPAERLVEDQTNSFTFVPGEISGMKLIGNVEVNEPGGAGWTIKLYRNGVYYDETTTDGTGAYSFAGLLPGEYTLEEVEDPDYMKVWPIGAYLGPFTVVSGSLFAEGTDFVNMPRPIGIDVIKTADPTVVHVGDTITYTIDVVNTGDVPVTLTSVLDPMLGGALLIAPVPLLPGQSLSDLGQQIVMPMTAPDADMVDNTAVASGTTVFGVVSDSDDAHVDILRPAIDVTKTVVPDAVLDSDLVTYYVTVTNTGNTPLTIDVTDYIDMTVHKVLDTDLVLGPGEHKDYEWDETVSMPVEDTVVATGVDRLGGDKGTVSDEASAAVAVDVTKTFSLGLFEAMPMADSYFVRYVIGGESTDLVLVAGADEYAASIIVPYGTEITSWQFFAMMGDEEIPLSEVMGPETLTGPLTNGHIFVPGRISGMKYDDVDGDGDQGDGEPGLAGWTINLYRDGVLYATDITDGEGAYSFTGLLPGDYTVEEEQQDGWEMTEGPESGLKVDNEIWYTGVDFGNHHLDVTKTFSLTYPGAPDDVTFLVRYQLAEGDPVTVPLTGEGPFVGTDEIPWGSVITAVWWIAEYQGHEIVLGIDELEETLTEDITNEFTYTASVSGFKFDDIDGNGVWDEPDETGLEGWTIGLYRLTSPNGILAALPTPELGYELYAQTVTGADGSYSFTGVLPGTYYLAEEQQEGWVMTVSPEGVFLVQDGVALTDLNFGNQEPPLPFTDTELEKVADKKTADPGDLVTYTLTYRNIGDGIIEGGVKITDDYDERYMVVEDIGDGVEEDGVITWVDSVPLGPGDERTITYTMRIIDDMPTMTTHIDNIAVIDPGFHEATWRVTVSSPFLPFTGATLGLLALVATGALLIGIALRRKAHSV